MDPRTENQLRRVLAEHGNVRFALVFGSSVRLGSRAPADLDIAVSLSRDLSLMDLGKLEAALEYVSDRPVDVVDIADSNTLLRREIARDGKVFYCADSKALLHFRARVPIEYFDLQPFLEREAKGLRRALGVR